ncbi:hypothetical protein GCM10011516_14730 [Sphingobacterium cellulitidis]|uniref:Uncharacterized protein n=1 Tax=Sphingobacterium cellulitidis TaxID=1768011 RepID=A0A8H9KVA1_9SPHI|nr:hypothetical protein GCM10011516_14730 [Sphingobacterium soli]
MLANLLTRSFIVFSLTKKIPNQYSVGLVLIQLAVLSLINQRIADSFAIGKMSGCLTTEIVNLTRNSWFLKIKLFFRIDVVRECDGR